MIKMSKIRRCLVAGAVVAAGFGLAGCEPGEGSQADNLRDGIKGWDSEPDIDCEVLFCDEGDRTPVPPPGS